MFIIIEKDGKERERERQSNSNNKKLLIIIIIIIAFITILTLIIKSITPSQSPQLSPTPSPSPSPSPSPPAAVITCPSVSPGISCLASGTGSDKLGDVAEAIALGNCADKYNECKSTQESELQATITQCVVDFESQGSTGCRLNSALKTDKKCHLTSCAEYKKIEVVKKISEGHIYCYFYQTTCTYTYGEDGGFVSQSCTRKEVEDHWADAGGFCTTLHSYYIGWECQASGEYDQDSYECVQE